MDQHYADQTVSIHRKKLFRVRVAEFPPGKMRNGKWANVENELFKMKNVQIGRVYRALTFRIIYLSGTVGNICLIADARSVIITSAFYFPRKKIRNGKKRKNGKTELLFSFSSILRATFIFIIGRRHNSHPSSYTHTHRAKVARIACRQKWIRSVVGDDWKMTGFLAFHRLYVQIVKMAVDLLRKRWHRNGQKWLIKMINCGNVFNHLAQQQKTNRGKN